MADDPKGEKAIVQWLDEKDDLLAGRMPRPKTEGFTLRELLDRFMVAKRHLLDTQEISPRHFSELYACCRRIGDAFGLHRLVADLTADDFEKLRRNIAKNWGPIRLGNEIQRVRSVFKYGYDAGFIAAPVRFGPLFKRPTRKVLRLNRAKNGVGTFEAAEIRSLLDAASPAMKAMILLGVNCGYGNGDVAKLPTKALDLKAGWVTFPRPKTGVPRRCHLWPETAAAIKAVLAQRPKSSSPTAAGAVFLTVRGNRWSGRGLASRTRRRESW